MEKSVDAQFRIDKFGRSYWSFSGKAVAEIENKKPAARP